MKAPDKIIIPLSTAKMYKDEGPLYKGVEYIRKEALLKWAKAKHMELDPPQNERDFGHIEAVEELINKINSL